MFTVNYMFTGVHHVGIAVPAIFLTNGQLTRGQRFLECLEYAQAREDSAVECVPFIRRTYV